MSIVHCTSTYCLLVRSIAQLFAKLVFLVGGFALGPLVNAALLVELFRHRACDSLSYALYAVLSFADLFVRPPPDEWPDECPLLMF